MGSQVCARMRLLTIGIRYIYLLDNPVIIAASALRFNFLHAT